MVEANRGHACSYGDDEWTAEATDSLRELFEIDCEVFFVFNGTAANSLALASLCRSFHSVICQENAHVETDECGGPEFFSNGTKVLLVGGENGKVDPGAVEHAVRRRQDIHYPKPQVLSLTQATEFGTVYTVEELDRLREAARRCGLKVHLDGARFANAVAALGISPKEITWKVGVDVLCFGGTKNGMAVGESVVFFNKELAYEFDYRCKQAGQLASKMRFLAAPWVGVLKSGAWLRNAQRSNSMAKLLYEEIKTIPGIEILHPVQANSVFVQMPEETSRKLTAHGWKFYTFIGGGSRLMCSWDTTENDVLSFAQDLQTISGTTG